MLHDCMMKYPSPVDPAMASAMNSTAIAVPTPMRSDVNTAGMVAGITTWRYSSQREPPSDRIESDALAGMAFTASRTATSTWKNTVSAISAIFGASARPSSTSRMGSRTTLGMGYRRYNTGANSESSVRERANTCAIGTASTVPMAKPATTTEALAPGEEEREILRASMDRIRSEHSELVAISFPGDEKSSGGCLAAGRGFFHINSHGGAEPCPFSPHTAANIKATTLKEALNAALFRALRAGDLLAGDHDGGCVLYEKREEVERLVEQQSAAEHKEQYLTVGRFSKLGKGYARCCGPTAITNLIMTLKEAPSSEDPDEVFLSVAKAGTKRGIYMNMDLFKKFGGTSNFLSEPYIKTCLKKHGVQADLHYLGRLTEERLERALRRGSYLYLELMFHPKYGNHHVLCYGARPTKDGWLLRIADGWMSKPVELTLEQLKRTYAIEVIHA